MLLDISMPHLDGLDAIPRIRGRLPATKILILSMHDDPEYLRQAIRAGADGYILKKAADTELLAAIKAVMGGDLYVHSSMTKELLADLFDAGDSPPTNDHWDALSLRERQTLKMVALGHTSAEIAARLNLSAKTIDTYRSRGMEKLNLKTRANLVRFAIDHDLLE